MIRIALGLLALVLAAAPLAGRADLSIIYKGLYLMSAQHGCHLESRNVETKTSMTRCGVHEMTGKAEFTTNTEVWTQTKPDSKRGGCATSAWTIAPPPATHQFDFMLRNQSPHSPIVCHYAWLNTTTIDVWFTDK